MAYYDFLNVVFSPLLKLPVAVAVILLAFMVSVIIILITKYTTNQNLMKQLKDEMKGYQTQIKESRSNPSKAMELQKKAMEVNMKYMMHSLKPTLVTFIPIILIFGWMSSIFAYQSIQPNETFSITSFFKDGAEGEVLIIVPEGISIINGEKQNITDNKATWNLKGKEGEYILEFDYQGEKQQKEVLITEGNEYTISTKKFEGKMKSAQIDYKKRTVIPIGYKDWLGWLGTYIISSIIFTMSLRKLMKVY